MGKITKTSDFMNRLEKFIPRMFSDPCLLKGADIDEPLYYPTANRVQENQIMGEKTPCYTLEWQNRTMQDNYTQRQFREGDLKIRVFVANNDSDLRITRDYLQNCTDLILQGLASLKYRKYIRHIGKIEVLNQSDTNIPNRPHISGKEMVARLTLS